MTERTCLHLTQEGRCSNCGMAPEITDLARDGRRLTQSVCVACNAARIDPKEPVQEQSADEGPLERLTQARKAV